MGVMSEGVSGEGVEKAGEESLGEEAERGEQASEIVLVESLVPADDTPLEESEVHSCTDDVILCEEDVIPVE